MRKTYVISGRQVLHRYQFPTVGYVIGLDIFEVIETYRQVGEQVGVQVLPDLV